jgi:hypothetical protein
MLHCQKNDEESVNNEVIPKRNNRGRPRKTELEQVDSKAKLSSGKIHGEMNEVIYLTSSVTADLFCSHVFSKKSSFVFYATSPSPLPFYGSIYKFN